MEKKKAFFCASIVFLGLVPLLFMAGCRKKPAGLGKVTLNYGYFATPDRVKINEKIVRMFEETHPHIRVATQTAPYGPFFQKIRIQLAGNSAPDLWVTDGVFLLEWADRDAAKDLTAWAKRDMNLDDYYCMEATRDLEGRIWGIPRAYQSFALYYNKDLFDEAGLAYPTNEWIWDDLFQAAQKLTRDTNDDGRIDEFGFDGHMLWFNLIYQNGTTFLDETKTKSLFNTPKVIEATQLHVDLRNKYKVAPTVANIASFGAQLASPHEMFFAGRIAMWLGLYADIHSLRKIPHFRYDVVLPPKKITRNCYYNPNCFVITRTSPPEKQEAAWEFIKFFSTYEIQKLFGQEGEGVPFLKKAALDLVKEHEGQPENIKVFVDVLRYSITMDLNSVWNEWLNKATQNESEALLGIKTVKEACLEAHKEVQEVLDKAYLSK